jgi:hypothetical protein
MNPIHLLNLSSSKLSLVELVGLDLSKFFGLVILVLHNIKSLDTTPTNTLPIVHSKFKQKRDDIFNNPTSLKFQNKGFKTFERHPQIEFPHINDTFKH